MSYNPNAQKSRTRMTVKVSTDDGMTWPESEWMLLDALQSRGYSCLTSVDRKTLGILYESSQADMVFQLLPIPRHLLRKKIR
jgi:sialidase-1